MPTYFMKDVFNSGRNSSAVLHKFISSKNIKTLSSCLHSQSPLHQGNGTGPLPCILTIHEP